MRQDLGLPKSAAVLNVARFKTMREYIVTRRQTVVAPVVGMPVLRECWKAERRHGTVKRLMWWDQDIDWDVAYEAAAKTAGGPGSESE